MTRRRVGVVTIAHGRHAHLAAQHRSLAAGSRRPDRYVVVAMDDPAITAGADGGVAREVVRVGASAQGLPLARARNVGVAHLADDVDTVIMLDVDCLAGPELVEAYDGVVAADPGTVWSGPVTYLPPLPDGPRLDDLAQLDDPHPARPAPAPGEVLREARVELFWSLSFAVPTRAWTAIGGFCEEYVGYGAEDTDFARLAADAGLDFAWVGSARAYHQHHAVSRPPVEHVDDIVRNATLFERRWGAWPMLGWLEEFEHLGLVRRHDGRWVRSVPGTDRAQRVSRRG